MKRYIKASFSASIPDWLLKKLGNYGIKRKLLDKGIALDTAKFLDHDPGTGKVLPVYLLKTDYGNNVYIPTVNDDDSASINGRYRKLGSIAKSKLPGMAVDVYFLDMTDPETMHPPKSRYRDPRYDYNRYEKHGSYAGQYQTEPYLGRDPETDESMYGPKTWTATGRSNRDKSGYKIPSPEEMISRFYEKYPEKLADKVDNVYQEILDAREQIFAYDFRELGEDRYSSRVSNAYNYLSSAISEYRDMLSNIKDAERYSSIGYKMDTYTLKRISNHITSIRKRLDEAVNLLYPGNRA